TLFKAKQLWEVFKTKRMKIDLDDIQRKELKEIGLSDTDWFGQKYESTDGDSGVFYGTDEEQSFINFISNFIERLKEKYLDILLLRNEKFFQVFDFDEGRAFEPDFVMLLKEKIIKLKFTKFLLNQKEKFTPRPNHGNKNFY
ncbi:MAG: hypothetical protein ABIK90_07760, partial [candidate division WOR-3 bacterium]